MFRNLGAGLRSELIHEATDMTYRCWVHRYGELPEERLRKPLAEYVARSATPLAGTVPAQLRTALLRLIRDLS
jgi:hypothetical protein